MNSPTGFYIQMPTDDEDGCYLASEIVLERAIGQPVIWRFAAYVEYNDPRLPYIAALLESSQLKVKAFFNEGPAGQAGSALGLEGLVVGAEWCSKRANHLLIEAHATSLSAAPSPAPDPDPFTPRWRVHDSVQNLLKLAQKFSHVATLPNWVKTPMEKVKFTPDDYTSVLQDGLSDWAFMSHLLDQYGMLGTEAAMKPLVLMGSIQEAPGKWIVTYGSKAAYEKMNDVSGRTVEPKPEDLETFVFGANQLSEAQGTPRSLVPFASRLWRRHEFKIADWDAWLKKDLPFFSKDQRFIYRVVDRLVLGNQKGQRGGWTTQLDPLPEGAVVAGPEPPARIGPWIRTGLVDESKPRGPWIKVKLEGFESGAETVQARLQSPYTGTDGRKGLHLVPESKTNVFLAWSGRFHEPLMVLGNVRQEETEFEAPSLWLEALLTEQYADILVKEVGKTTVESDFNVVVQKKMVLTGEDTADLSSAKAMTLKSDDAATVESAKDLSLKSSTANVNAEGLEVQVKGQTAVKMEGTQLELKGTATAKLESSGILEVKGSLVKIN